MRSRALSALRSAAHPTHSSPNPVTVWVQALAWSPFPSPYVRVPILVLAIVPIVALWIWVGYNNGSTVVFASAIAGTLVLMLVAYGVGLLGLSRTRAGNEWDLFRYLAECRTMLLRNRAAGPIKIRRPFRSANAAQLWYERRRNALFMPAMLGFCSMFVLALLISTMREPGNNPGVMIGSIQVPPSVIALGLLLFLPILCSTMTSQNIAKFDLWGKTEMTPFFAARPISTTQLVRNKMKTAAICALACWGIVISILLTWAVLDISPVNRQPSLVRGFLDQATTKDLVKVLLAAVLFLFIIWRNLAVWMWPALIGRKWISTAIGLLAAGAVFCAPGLYGWLLRQPDLKETLARAAVDFGCHRGIEAVRGRSHRYGATAANFTDKHCTWCGSADMAGDGAPHLRRCRLSDRVDVVPGRRRGSAYAANVTGGGAFTRWIGIGIGEGALAEPVSFDHVNFRRFKEQERRECQYQ